MHRYVVPEPWAILLEAELEQINALICELIEEREALAACEADLRLSRSALLQRLAFRDPERTADKD